MVMVKLSSAGGDDETKMVREEMVSSMPWLNTMDISET